LISDELYLGLDGTGVPMRASELFGRKGKQPDGSAKNGKPDEIYRRAGFDLSGLREKLLEQEGTSSRKSLKSSGLSLRRSVSTSRKKTPSGVPPHS
jgi:hypothetical protein